MNKEEEYKIYMEAKDKLNKLSEEVDLKILFIAMLDFMAERFRNGTIRELTEKVKEKMEPKE